MAALIGVAVAVAMVALGAYFWAVALVVLSGLGAGIGAYQHAVNRSRQWLTVLWVSSLGLAGMTVLAVFSVGVFLLPGALAALVAAGTGTWRSATGGQA